MQVVQATRTHPEVELGASPRASLGLYRCSQALAAVRGREYVTPDELKTLAPYALSHRVILRSQARLRERNASGIIARNGGIVELGELAALRTVLLLDGALVIHHGTTITGWSHK